MSCVTDARVQSNAKSSAESDVAQPQRPAVALPVVVFAVGNPSRGDDALGPLLAERIEAAFPDIVVISDFQLQIEHALDLVGAELILFIDACVGFEALPAMGAGIAVVDDEGSVRRASSGDADPDAGHGTEDRRWLRFHEVHPSDEKPLLSHAMRPEAVLRVSAEYERRPPPPAFVLGLRAEHFELGESLSASARIALDRGWRLLQTLFAHPDPGSWRTQAQVLHQQREAAGEHAPEG